MSTYYEGTSIVDGKIVVSTWYEPSSNRMGGERHDKDTFNKISEALESWSVGHFADKIMNDLCKKYPHQADTLMAKYEDWKK